VSLALVIQHAKRMRRTIFSSVACPAVPHISTLFNKHHDFREHVTENKTCVLIFATTSVRNTSHSKRNSVRWPQMYIDRHVQSTLFLSDFNETSWESLQWEPSCSMRTHTHTNTHGRRDEA